VDTVRVGKIGQGVALGVLTLGILAATLALEGKRPVGTNLAPFEDLGRVLVEVHKGGLLSGRNLLNALGIFGNLVLFVPWGFLAWKLLDGRSRHAVLVYLEMLSFGLLLSAGIELVQLFLATRAADVNDVIWNVLGTAAGGGLAHAGKRIQVEWE
jgi:glycopeptide antibiotics resistance protein